MKPVFDKNLSYGEVFGPVEGQPAARFCQNGSYYKNDGSPCNPEVESTVEEPVEPAVEVMHWRTLRKKVEAAGGEYTDREEAVKFLEELDG